MSSYFEHPSQEFIYTRTYARWLEKSKRRETWPETVGRYVSYMKFRLKSKKIPDAVWKKISENILSMRAMPSMRSMWTAGPALERSPTCGYNCTFLPVNSIESFSECLYCLMCGAGVGFSVEWEYVKNLPTVGHDTGTTSGTHVVDDSKEGWADSVKLLVQALYAGSDLHMDYSALRPEGSRLKTMGGRSSGPAPLIILHEFLRNVFSKAQGRQLTCLECHDIMNQIADIVVSGGVRRSSQISLSDLDNDEMANAKVGNFPKRRQLANNSAVYHEKPTAARFLTEWSILANSGSGERGIFNLQGAQRRSPRRRKSNLVKGTNPCVEILLRLFQMCNLSEAVVRHDDDLDDLIEKVKTATWIGVIQPTITDFKYLRPEWQKNCEEERLLGVSLTGQLDNYKLMSDPTVLSTLNKVAIKTARRAAKIVGIPMSASVTCGKPSGTVSQLVNSSSGAHGRFSDYYLRRYRIDSVDPLFHMMKDQGVYLTPEVGHRRKDWNQAKKGNTDQCAIYDGGEWSSEKVRTWVCEFPVASPKKCVKRNDLDALQQLEHYKKVQENWCEHNQSITVYVKNDEWFAVGNWVYENWDLIGGVSFLPYDGGKYELTPYEELTREDYLKKKKAFPEIDYSKLSTFEETDLGRGNRELACKGGSCEI